MVNLRRCIDDVSKIKFSLPMLQTIPLVRGQDSIISADCVIMYGVSTTHANLHFSAFYNVLSDAKLNGTLTIVTRPNYCCPT